MLDCYDHFLSIPPVTSSLFTFTCIVQFKCTSIHRIFDINVGIAIFELCLEFR